MQSNNSSFGNLDNSSIFNVDNQLLNREKSPLEVDSFTSSSSYDPASSFEFNGNTYALGEYQIQEGETLGHLAQEAMGDSSVFGVIASINGIKNPNEIFAGQEILLPMSVYTLEEELNPQQNVGVYTVSEGDTLAKIAEKIVGDASAYEELAAYNGISNSNFIFEGQELLIPIDANPTRSYDDSEILLPSLKQSSGSDDLGIVELAVKAQADNLDAIGAKEVTFTSDSTSGEEQDENKLRVVSRAIKSLGAGLNQDYHLKSEDQNYVFKRVDGEFVKFASEDGKAKIPEGYSQKRFIEIGDDTEVLTKKTEALRSEYTTKKAKAFDKILEQVEKGDLDRAGHKDKLSKWTGNRYANKTVKLQEEFLAGKKDRVNYETDLSELTQSSYGNFAASKGDIPDVDKELAAFSNYPIYGENDPRFAGSSKSGKGEFSFNKFIETGGGNTRSSEFDSERDILNKVGSQIGSDTTRSGTLHIHTEKKPCVGCLQTKLDFEAKYPNIDTIFTDSNNNFYPKGSSPDEAPKFKVPVTQKNLKHLAKAADVVDDVLKPVGYIADGFVIADAIIKDGGIGENTGRTGASMAGEWAGSTVGAWGGAKAGALLGTAIAPGVGTVIGGAVGGIAGGWFGGEIGTKAGSDLFNLSLSNKWW